MIPIELICRELKRLRDDYKKCENTEIKKQINSDIELLSEALFLCDHPSKNDNS